MPGKDFEQQVREQFSHWNQQPSGKVWDKLEAALLQQKRRRRFAYLFLVAGLLAGALWLGNSYRMSKAVQLPVSDARPLTAPAGSGSVESPHDQSTDPANKPNPGSQPREQTAIQSSPTAPIQGNLAGNKAVHDDAKGTAPGPMYTDGQVEGIAGNEKPAPVAPHTTNRSAGQLDKQKPAPTEMAGKKTIPSSQLAKPGEQVLETVLVTADLAAAGQSPTPRMELATIDPAGRSRDLVLPTTNTRKIGQAPDLQVSSAPAPDLKRPAKRSLALGISAGWGRSSYGNGLSLSTQKMADQVSSPSTGTPSAPAQYSYQQNPAGAGEIGLWMRWSLSRRWSLKTGLAYQQWHTHTPVGAMGSGTLNFTNGIAVVSSPTSYSSGRQGEYTNRYQMLSLPIDVEWQLNAGRKLPVIWTLGLVPGTLLSSNALVGQGDTVLYHHPDNQQRMQLGLRSSLMFRIMPKRERPIDIGPVFQYQLNRVFISSLPEDGHLHYLGLEARMPILFLRRAQR